VSNNLMHFNFNGNGVRVVVRDGEPWWVAADACRVLGIDTTQTRRLDQDEKGLCSIQTPGGTQDVLCVNEPGLYSLVLGSRKPEAKAFKRWINHEVLPQIRKTGTYSVTPVHQIPQTYSEALRLAADLADKVQELTPKAAFADAVASSEDGQSIGEVAKVLGTGQNRLFRWLRGERILMASNLPYQDFIDGGYFRVIEQKWESKAGRVNLATKTLITGKGLLWLQKRFNQGA
jgi:anti-repressor protein